jgi:hypothetical protein
MAALCSSAGCLRSFPAGRSAGSLAIQARLRHVRVRVATFCSFQLMLKLSSMMSQLIPNTS